MMDAGRAARRRRWCDHLRVTKIEAADHETRVGQAEGGPNRHKYTGVYKGSRIPKSLRSIAPSFSRVPSWFQSRSLFRPLGRRPRYRLVFRRPPLVRPLSWVPVPASYFHHSPGDTLAAPCFHKLHCRRSFADRARLLAAHAFLDNNHIHLAAAATVAPTSAR